MDSESINETNVYEKLIPSVYVDQENETAEPLVNDDLHNYALSSASSIAMLSNNNDKDDDMLNLDVAKMHHIGSGDEINDDYCAIIYPSSYYIYHNRNASFSGYNTVLHNRTPDSDFDEAIIAKKQVIFIYDRILGDYTCKWITLGNFMHKMAVISGLSTLCLQPFIFTKLLHAIFNRKKCNVFTPFDHYNNLSHPKSQFSNCINIFSMTTTGLSLFGIFIYTFFWSFDPCCKYQVLRSFEHVKPGPIREAIVRHFTDNYFPESEFAQQYSKLTHLGGDKISVVNKDMIEGLYSDKTSNSPLKTKNIEEDFRPVVLIYKDDTRRKYLHYAISALALVCNLFNY